MVGLTLCQFVISFNQENIRIAEKRFEQHLNTMKEEGQ